MLLVATELRPSSIHGTGVFLLEPVKKGQLVWRFDSRVDRVYSQEELDSLPEVAREFVRDHAFWDRHTSLWVLCGDNAKYVNHSTNPTILPPEDNFIDDVATRDLDVGEELTDNYYVIHDNAEELQRMGLRER